MKKKLLFLLLYIVSNYSQAQTMRFATYNIRGDLARDTPANMWKDRAPKFPNLIRFHNFDLFGTQEGAPHQLEYLHKALPEYTLVAEGKYGALNSSAIFFKSNMFQLLKSGSFWLSPTPNKPGKAWDAKHPRGCSWVMLKEISSGRTFYYFNTHFDHIGEQARRNSAQLILQKIKEIAGSVPVAAGGDFNANQYSESYATLNNSGLLKDACELADIRYLPNGTGNGFNITRNSDERVDHIFLTNHFEVKRYGILTDSYGGKFPSDHFPVLIEATFKK